MKGTRNKSREGLTLVEVLIVVCVIALIAGIILLPSLKPATHRSRIGCVNNLKQISLGFRLWSNDNGDSFPWNVKVQDDGAMKNDGSNPLNIVCQFLVASNEIGSPKVIVCPNDSDKKYATNWSAFAKQDATHPNISYFYDQDATEKSPQAFLVGDRSLLPTPGAPIPKGISGAPTLSLNRSNYTTLDWDLSKMHKGFGYIALVDGSAMQVNRVKVRQQAGIYLDGKTNQMRLYYPGY